MKRYLTDRKHHNMLDTSLTNPKVCINTGISSSTSETLVFPGKRFQKVHSKRLSKARIELKKRHHYDTNQGPQKA